MDEKWVRLGQLLTERRVALGFRFRRPWAINVLGLKNDRIQADLETARRDNYDLATLAQVEQQYEWAPGSIREVLNGGMPTPIELTGRRDPERESPVPPATRMKDLFDQWVDLYVQMLPLELEYGRLRDIPDAHDELVDILMMAQQGKDGRPWTPPWEIERLADEYELTADDPAFEPWRSRWWQTGREGLGGVLEGLRRRRFEEDLSVTADTTDESLAALETEEPIDRRYGHDDHA